MSSDVKRCAACRTEKPVSEMKVCMHAEMHNYVCDSKCMNDFYNPPKVPTDKERIAALEAECQRLRAQVSALQSDANSWQSGYDKGREDGAKAADGWKAQHARDSAELRRLCAERDALAAELAAIKGQEVDGGN